MGDRCYMSVTCRRRDRERFEKLGFQIEFAEDKNTAVIKLVDQEADYAHYGAMPKDIPYLAGHAAGDDYGPGNIVCDGQHYLAIAASNDGFVVIWDYRRRKPTAQSLTEIRRFIRLERRVKALFKTIR
jgi:hypothetical protein